MEWAEKIRCIENELGIENERGRLARLLGIRPGTISDIKNRKAKNPGSDIALLLINRLGVNPEWLESGSLPVMLSSRLTPQPFGRTSDHPRSRDLNLLAELVTTQEVETSTLKSGKSRFTDQPGEGTIGAEPGEGGPPDGMDEAAGERDMAVVAERTEAARPRIAGEIPLIYAGDERLKKGIIIPFLEDQSVSAGPGAELDEGDNPSRYLRAPEYLARYPDLAMLPVRGDSMDPTLHDGDMVVCDGGGWDGDGIYVIKTEEKAFVKRVLFTPDGYQVISDNKLYPAYGTRNENLTIVGKVRAAVIMMPGRRGGI
jgi:hypothetical protein